MLTRRLSAMVRSANMAALMRNLALHKPASQSSTSIWSASSKPDEDAKGANKGAITQLYGFHTAQESNPWWQVDLEAEFLIRKIVLYNRNDYWAVRLKHFSILGSLDGKDWQVIFRKRDRSVFGFPDDLPYVAEIGGDHLARYIRVRLDGLDSLHFRECRVFGEPAAADLRIRLVDEAERAQRKRLQLPPERNGKLIEIDDFLVFGDRDSYASSIISALESGRYEIRERGLAKEILEPGDRVIEAGTAIGLVAMTAASIVGAANVLTFDANPEIAADARRNFDRNGLVEIESRWGLLKNRHSIRQESETADFYIDEDFWASREHATEHDQRIQKKIQVPVYCFEDEIAGHGANVLICDIEGGEVKLLTGADLDGIKKIIIETHYGFVGERETDEMVKELISNGFSIHLSLSGGGVTFLRR